MLSEDLLKRKKAITDKTKIVMIVMIIIIFLSISKDNLDCI
jgi:hypothetical protein